MRLESVLMLFCSYWNGFLQCHPIMLVLLLSLKYTLKVSGINSERSQTSLNRWNRSIILELISRKICREKSSFLRDGYAAILDPFWGYRLTEYGIPGVNQRYQSILMSFYPAHHALQLCLRRSRCLDWSTLCNSIVLVFSDKRQDLVLFCWE